MDYERKKDYSKTMALEGGPVKTNELGDENMSR